MRKYFAVLDMGCDEITALAARWLPNGEYEIGAFCRGDSAGLSGGVVKENDTATESLSKVLKKLKDRFGRGINEVYAGIRPVSVAMTRSRGSLVLSRYGREIYESDIEKCVKIASTLRLPLDREPIHRIIRDFSIDGEKGIIDPRGLEGVKLESEVSIITVNTSVINNLSGCISRAGFVPSGFFFSALASSYRALSEDDRQVGAALVDICDTTSGILVFSGGVLTDCKVIASGTEDLFKNDGILDDKAIGKFSSYIIPMNGWDNVDKMVITGSGTLKEGLVESFDGHFDFPVTVGICFSRPLEDLPPDRAGYISNLGILDHIQKERAKRSRSRTFLKDILARISGFIEKYF